jgi:hypothetical protein
MKQANNSGFESRELIRPRRFLVSLPDETVFMALSRELYRKYEITPKEAIQLLVLEYVHNEVARSMIDRVLEGVSK